MPRNHPPSSPPLPVASVPPVSLGVVVERLGAHGRGVDGDLLSRVYEFSAERHKDQTRRSGEPYLTHPLAVSYLLADWNFDPICVAVGLLHDVLEDTLSTRAEIEDLFGGDIAELVDGVTKIGRHEYVRRDEAQAETFRKMILASARDIRVIVVKLADRLHNMLTLDALAPEARRRISRETLEIYAPIAHRLGMARIKGDLEDLAFYFLYPHQFAELHSKIEEKLKVGHEAIEGIHQRLGAALAEAAIEADLSYRVKRYYSIYQKLNRQGIDISQLYDYLAFRVVTRDLRDTYAALGVVHQNWRPIPGRFKDYVAMPKPNLYQSLHTTVVGPRGQPFEVQMRTREMDLVAEEGIAAHWLYKERGPHAASDPNILWLRQLLEWQKEVQDPRTFLTSLKVDLYPDEVYLFTPKGEVLSFPRGVTPVDFAFKVHTELGSHCAGARVNGKLVPLRTKLQNGDLVEIIANPNRHPSRDWLNWVVTSRAKSKIRHWLATEQKRRAEEIGRRLLERELRRYKLNPKKALEGPALEALLREEGIASVGDLASRIGFGKMSTRQVLERLTGTAELPEPAAPGRLRRAINRLIPGASGSNPIVVKGMGDLLAFRAKCCNPLPGEAIVGFVTRGRGVSVHATHCSNVRNLFYHPEREIEVQWAKESGGVYPATLHIETRDRQGLLARLTKVVAEYQSNITSFEARSLESGQGTIEMVLEVRDSKHLANIIGGLRGTAGVIQVRRQEAGGEDGEAADA